MIFFYVEQIVCMRKSVRQAKVQIINRLISQIKKYKNRKGNPKDQEKAKRKADRILDEIQVLKVSLLKIE